MIKGQPCVNVVVAHSGCVPGDPHYDPEGVVCNSGQVDEAEAYCSYTVGANACA